MQEGQLRWLSHIHRMKYKRQGQVFNARRQGKRKSERPRKTLDPKKLQPAKEL